MTRTYSCPECDEDVPVRDEKTVACPHCNTRLLVDEDGEIEDGQWRDLTKLRKLDTT